MNLLRVTIPVSNALCDLAGALEDHGHEVAGERVIWLRSTFDRFMCGLTGHPRIVYGAMRDICLDCLTVVDEHPNGRGRESETEHE